LFTGQIGDHRVSQIIHLDDMFEFHDTLYSL
jgi:hypothetical protein